MENLNARLLSLLFALMLGGFPSLVAQEEPVYEEENYDEYSEDEYYDNTYSEEEYYDDAAGLSEDFVRKSEFHIPSSPAFFLMGVTPEIVGRPGTVQDFKVDWRLKNYNIAPDLAIEGQPLWVLLYDRKGLDEYRKATPFMKTLSTMSLSFGTSKIDGINHFSYGMKINLARERDPVSDPELLRDMAREMAGMEEPLRAKLKVLREELDSTVNREERILIREQLFNTRSEIRQINRVQKERLIDLQQEYMRENWNSSSLDFAIGRVHTYNNAFDTLNIQAAGWGAWLSGAKGFGRRSMVSGIARFKQVGENTDLMLGLSYHFGGARFSFFTELIYESLENNSINGFSEDELFASNFSEDIGNGWIKFAPGLEAISQVTLTYGGNFRLSNGILLNFALRTRLDQNLKFKKLLPVANVTCLMR
ncbi:MAG: hypothetical protein KTR24_13995 [Saprospiraceae bacterium]|nr:hypothetical protein [Saprospiraceae bacterium]